MKSQNHNQGTKMRQYRKIIDRTGNLCTLACGHKKKSRGKYYAICLECESQGLKLINTQFGKFTYKTTTTSHTKCMERLASKCNWEHMGRVSVLMDWKTIVCEDCRKEMDFREVQYD